MSKTSKKAPSSLIDAIAGQGAASESKKKLDALQSELEAAKKIIEQQQERIEALGKKRWSIPTQGKSSRPERDGHVRLIISDTHGSAIDWKAYSAMLDDVEALAPTEIIHLGDVIDCGGFLAQHHTMGYVAETSYTFENDVDQANVALDKIQAVAPKASFDLLEGNHDRRLETFCLTQALRNQQDAAYLNSLFGVEAQLHVKKRGINLFKQGVFYDKCRIPATIRRGNCFFTHGSSHGKNAANVMLARFGANVVFGHVHKILSASDRTVKHGEIGAWCPGGLCKQQPLWHHTNPTDWSCGYAVQLVRPNGDFLHINVPVINGKSYLVNLAKKVG